MRIVARPRIAFSPDLALVALDNIVYDLSQALEHTEIGGLSILEDNGANDNDPKPAITKERSTLQAEFSHCNSVVCFTESGSVGKNRQPNVSLYQLKMTSHKSLLRTGIPLNLQLQSSTFVTTKWHPRSPILGLVTWNVAKSKGLEELFAIPSCYTMDLAAPHADWKIAEEPLPAMSRRTYIMRLVAI